MSTPSVEPFAAANATPAPFGGRRRSGKKMRLVKPKTVRRMLKKMGLRMRGGAPAMVAGADAAADMDKLANAPGPAATPVVSTSDSTSATGSGRRRSSKRTRRGRSKRGIFGMRY
jgi:hypothetical protein